jgi:hypothetical protein
MKKFSLIFGLITTMLVATTGCDGRKFRPIRIISDPMPEIGQTGYPTSRNFVLVVMRDTGDTLQLFTHGGDYRGDTTSVIIGTSGIMTIEN